MRALLHEDPLFLLFAVAALGFVIGRWRVLGVSAGVAAVLFVGLAASALDPALQLPEVVQQLGLVLFVYTLGLSAGPGFFAAFRRRGARDAAFALGAVALGALLSGVGAWLLGLDAAGAAGTFAGALTNTPALAEAVQQLRLRGGTGTALAAPVVAYSVAYPGGVLGVIAAMTVMRRAWGASTTAAQDPDAPGALENVSIAVDARGAGVALGPLREKEGWRLVFTRLRRDGAVSLTEDGTVLREGDVVAAVGHPDELAAAVARLGRESEVALSEDRSVIDFRRVVVSNAEVVARPLKELHLGARFGAIVTRVRRGDLDLLPDPEGHLELGDRVRVVAPRGRLDQISRYFGDSYRALAEIDVLSFGFGIALGLLAGRVVLEFPGGGSFRLGLAGGPLVVGLVLGRLGRSGPLTWELPYGASLTLRQLGMVLFLAGVGTRSGESFARSLREGAALRPFVLGLAVTFSVAFAALLVGRRWMKVPTDVLLGMVAGVHTQPAALGVAVEQSRSDAPNAGYAAVFPTATLAKIVAAQVLLALLAR